MKKIIILLLITLFILTSCNATPSYQSNQSQNNAIMRVADDTSGYTIYVDSQNGVMYFCRDGGYGRSVTVMYEPDGTIKIYPDFKGDK